MSYFLWLAVLHRYKAAIYGIFFKIAIFEQDLLDIPTSKLEELILSLHKIVISQNKKRLSRVSSGPEVKKLFSCSTQLSIKYFLLINVKMPKTVGILTFLSGKIAF